MQTLLSISILAVNVDIQSFTWLTKEKEFEKSAVITLSKEKKTEEKFFSALIMYVLSYTCK
jgi:hypothetical protein